MAIKKLFIAALLFGAFYFVIPAWLRADTPVSSFCDKFKCEALYNINRGYIDITKQGRNARIYLTLPYIVSGGNIHYMDRTPIIDKKGEIELPDEYCLKLSQIFSQTQLSNASIITNAAGSFPAAATNEKSDQSVKSNYNIPEQEKGFIPIDTVIIDPGHGGKDPGGIGIDGIKEKEIVLSVAKIISGYLRKESSLQVEFTRNADVFVTLKDRTETTKEIIKKGKKPVFISIHGNISLNKNVRGVEVYSLSDRATDSEALSVETVENAGFSKNDVEKTEGLYFIIADLLKDAVRRLSERLSGEIGYHLNQGTGQNVKSDKKANFYVLRYNSVPSILVEIGYLSNSAEGKNLINREYQKKIAHGIEKGILSFIEKYNNTRGFKK